MAFTRFLDRTEGRIAYDVTGTGPLVICVPGMGELRSSYRFLAPALVGAGFRVATMDLRGHGDSDATFSAYDDLAAADDVGALVEFLGGPAVLVGNSMGAGAAVISAADRPEQTVALVLIGPFVRNGPPSPVRTAIFRAMIDGPWGRAAWLGYYPAYFPARKPLDFEEHRDEIARSLARPEYLRAFRATTHTSHAPAEAALERVTAPTLVVMGERDPDWPNPAAEAHWIAGSLGADLVMVRDAGHYPQAEEPELTSAAIIEWLRQADRDTTPPMPDI